MTPVEWVLASLAYSGLEYWLGKTDRVKPGSVLEVLLTGVKLAGGALMKRKN